MIVNKCIFCSVDLVESNTSWEHVIPNALGGDIKTKNATCVECNSKAGESIDLAIINPLHIWAVSLDIVRDRGKNPILKNLKDEKSGLKYNWKPGENPKVSFNHQVIKDGGCLTKSVLADTIGDAVEGLDWKKDPSDLKAERVNVGGFKLNNQVLNHRDLNTAKSLVKIALCYARFLKVEFSTSCISSQFILGNCLDSPVSRVYSDVVVVESSSEFPLHHGVFLYGSKDYRCLIAYITLFHFVEYVVVIDESYNGPDLFEGHVIDLIAGQPSTFNYQWIADPREVIVWRREPPQSIERFHLRLKNIQYWLDNKKLLWLQRATYAAAFAYLKAKTIGLTDLDASVREQQAFNTVLKKYGMDGQYEFSSNGGV